MRPWFLASINCFKHNIGHGAFFLTISTKLSYKLKDNSDLGPANPVSELTFFIKFNQCLDSHLEVELTKVRLEVMDGEGKTRGVANWTSLIFDQMKAIFWLESSWG